MMLGIVVTNSTIQNVVGLKEEKGYCKGNYCCCCWVAIRIWGFVWSLYYYYIILLDVNCKEVGHFVFGDINSSNTDMMCQFYHGKGGKNPTVQETYSQISNIIIHSLVGVGPLDLCQSNMAQWATNHQLGCPFHAIQTRGDRRPATRWLGGTKSIVYNK